MNEIAPRPHNSGHYTIEACVTSQFEQHVRAILGLPLGDPSLKVNAAGMLNVLGQSTMELTMAPIERALTLPGASAHWYGKSEIRPRRKLGHITVVGSSTQEVASKLQELQGIPSKPGMFNKETSQYVVANTIYTHTHTQERLLELLWVAIRTCQK